MTGTGVLVVRGLSVVLDGRSLVDGAGFTLGAGEVGVLMGPSGAGKTTVVRALLGLMPRRAFVSWSDYSVRRAGDAAATTVLPPALAALRGDALGAVFQNPSAALDPLCRVGREVAAALRQAGKPADPAAVAALLRTVGLDAVAVPGLAARRPHELSGGQNQRVCLALALACTPALLLLDEPTAALDALQRAAFLRVLRDAVEERRMAALVVTHDAGVARVVATRVWLMRDGRVSDGAVPDARARAAVPGALPRPASSSDEEDGPAVVVDGVSHAVGRGWRRLRVLHRLSVAFRARRWTAIVGPSGGGKSTLARLMTGAETPTVGRVVVDGVATGGLRSAARRARRRAVQLVWPEALLALDPRQTVAEAIAEALAAGAHDAADVEAGVARLAAEWSFPVARLHARPHALSGGELQRAALMRAFAVDPRVVVLDEALGALDPATRDDIVERLDARVRRAKLTVVLITHDLDLVRAIADDVVIVADGRVVATGPAAALVDPAAATDWAGLLGSGAAPARGDAPSFV